MGFLKKLVKDAVNCVKKVATATINFVNKIPKPVRVCLCLFVFMIIVANWPFAGYSYPGGSPYDPSNPFSIFYW